MELHDQPARGTPAASVAFCATCGVRADPDARFCTACGTRLRASSAAPLEADPVVGDLRSAQRLVDAGRFDAAIEALQALCAAHPCWASARVTLGIAYLRAARVDDAAELLAEAEALEPASFTCELAWAEYQARLGFYDRAVARLDRALALEPPSLQAHTAAVELQRHCRARAARLYYRQAVLPRFLSAFRRRGAPVAPAQH